MTVTVYNLLLCKKILKKVVVNLHDSKRALDFINYLFLLLSLSLETHPALKVNLICSKHNKTQILVPIFPTKQISVMLKKKGNILSLGYKFNIQYSITHNIPG